MIASLNEIDRVEMVISRLKYRAMLNTGENYKIEKLNFNLKKGSKHMPKDTFYNLPDEKKERVIDAAIDEFSKNSFHKARITAIADNASIAKGSFYQYFENKKDLYKYLMELLVEEKMSYINREMMINKNRYSFFQLLREVYLSGIRFAKENPRLLSIGTMLAGDKALLQEIYGENENISVDFFINLLNYGMEQGEIDQSIDVSLVANMMVALSFSLMSLVMEDGKLDLDDMETIDKMLYFIENGIKIGR